jgi:hypothetical protein
MPTPIIMRKGYQALKLACEGNRSETHAAERRAEGERAKMIGDLLVTLNDADVADADASGAEDTKAQGKRKATSTP